MPSLVARAFFATAAKGLAESCVNTSANVAITRAEPAWCATRYVAHQLRPHLDQSFRLAVQSGDVEALVAAAVAVFNYFNRLAKAPKAKGRRPQNPASIELSQSGG